VYIIGYGICLGGLLCTLLIARERYARRIQCMLTYICSTYVKLIKRYEYIQLRNSDLTACKYLLFYDLPMLLFYSICTSTGLLVILYVNYIIGLITIGFMFGIVVLGSIHDKHTELKRAVTAKR
jgi:hypothetical protein